jgi:hypothetical protein
LTFAPRRAFAIAWARQRTLAARLSPNDGGVSPFEHERARRAHTNRDKAPRSFHHPAALRPSLARRTEYEASAGKSEDVMNKMTATMSRVIVAAALMTAAASTMARAGDTKLVARVPFDFIVGDKLLPAGSYTISTVGEDNDVLWIESADGKQQATTQTIAYAPNDTPQQAQLEFEKFDDQYFLKRITPDGSEAREIVLTPSRMEKEIQAVALNP